MRYAQKALDFVVPLYAEYRQTFEMMFATSYGLISNLQDNAEPTTGGSHYPTAIGSLVSQPDKADFATAIAFARSHSFLEPPPS